MGIEIEYIGILPNKSSALITPCDYIDFECGESFYLSSLEASLSGVPVITTADRNCCYAVVDGAFDGSGKLSIITTVPLNDFRKKNPNQTRKAILTGGCVISVKQSSDMWSLSFGFSSCFLTYSGRTGNSIISGAIDTGIPTAVFRSSLSSRAMRELALEGAPVIESYSSLIELPKVIAYRTSRGRFGYRGSSFDSLFF